MRVSSSPLEWWKVNENRYAALAPVARQFLAVPATSTPSERIFSSSGLVVEKLRAALSAENVDALVFLHKNAKAIGVDPADALLKSEVTSTATASPVRKKKEEEGRSVGCQELELPQADADEGEDVEGVFWSPELPRLEM